MPPRSLFVLLFLALFCAPPIRADEPFAWPSPQFEGLRHTPAPSRSNWFTHFDTQFVLIQLGLAAPNRDLLLLSHNDFNPFAAINRRTLRIAASDVPARSNASTASASRVTIGSRDENGQGAFELRYLTGMADDTWGVSMRYGHTWNWETSTGLLGFYAGWRGEIYSWEMSTPIRGHFTNYKDLQDPPSVLVIESDIRTVLHQNVTLFTTGPEVGLDWRRPLGPQDLDFVGSGRVSPLFANLRRKSEVRRGFGDAADLHTTQGNGSFALAGVADVALAWSPNNWFTLVGGLRFDGLCLPGSGSLVFTESVYAGAELAF